MEKRLLVLGMAGMLVLGSGFELGAQELTEEELLFMEIPVVFASSKRLQPITEAASSIEIITAEEIKQSGATNIADVLRSVAGVDVREAHVSQHVVGIRGFADTQHVLVTIDGNNVFMYHANHIFFDWIPLDLEEIDRIEVIKGPGAIFYGGNAFSGAINIVTKTPRQLKGSEVNLAGGEWNTIRSNLIHGGSFKNLDYSISAGYRMAEEWEAPDMGQEEESFYVGHFGARGIYNINDDSSLSISGRYSTAENVISRVCNPDTIFVSLRYDRPDFWTRLFYNNHEKTFWSDTFGVKDSNYEVEVFKAIRRGNNITSFGGYAKKTNWEIEGLKGGTAGITERHGVEDFAVNIENEYHLSNQLILVLGGRAEYYTHLDFLGLGRGSIIYKYAEDQRLRFTISNGYYIPSLFEHTNEGTVYPFALGSYSLKEEKILAYELSYYSQVTDRIKLNASIFYNDYRDLIDDAQLGPQVNMADAYQYGGELELKFMLVNWLNGFVNYSYQDIHRDDFGDLAVDPEHKVNFGLVTTLAKWSANLAVHYVDKYYEIYLTSNPVFGRVGAGPEEVDSYTTVNARIAYNPIDNLELAVAAYNLNNDKHYESNSTTGWHTGDEIGHRITGSVSYKF